MPGSSPTSSSGDSSPVTLDPVSALLLDEAGEPLAAAPSAPILVLDDPALATRLHRDGRQVRAYCDDLREELQLPVAGLEAVDAAALDGVRVVVARLPKSLGLLEDYAQRIAAFAGPELRLLAGGREKHLSRGMNDVLGRSFGQVRASLGRQKSRVLHAAEPVPRRLSWPRQTAVAEVDITVVSHAGTFAAGRLDAGTRLLLGALAAAAAERTDAPATPVRAVDLGCGTGIVAAWLARRGMEVLAVDTSRAAVASARDTAAANQVDVEVRRGDGLAGQPAASIDLVACNPPFHLGTTKDSTPGFDLLRGAAASLRPDAAVYTVFNSHLPYLRFLREELGPTRVVARDRDYTVTATAVRAG